MIISFTVKNYKSIKDEMTLHFGADVKERMHSDHIAYPDKNRKIPVLRSIGVWGPNASGKSNLLQALGAMQDFVATSHKYDLDQAIDEYEPFRLDAACAGAPVFFELDFIGTDQEHYIYTLEFLKNKIIQEKLEFYASAKATVLFARGTGNGGTEIRFSAKLAGTKAIPCLDNQGYLSIAANHPDSSEQIKNVYRYIRNEINFISKKMNFITGKKLQKEDYRTALTKLLRCADTGIYDVKCKEEQINPESLPEKMPAGLKEKICNDFKWQPKFFHNNSDVEFSMRDESDGTIRLYEIAPVILAGISSPELFIFDELDCQLHPKLVEMVIRLFHDGAVNGKNPQLLFSTHNTALMDSDLFRRDQICFTQKNGEGATELTCLAEYAQVRSDTNFEKWYRDGRFDAIPELNYGLLRDAIQSYAASMSAEDTDHE